MVFGSTSAGVIITIFYWHIILYGIWRLYYYIMAFGVIIIISHGILIYYHMVNGCTSAGSQVQL
jgi:hypothetical protein